MEIEFTRLIFGSVGTFVNLFKDRAPLRRPSKGADFFISVCFADQVRVDWAWALQEFKSPALVSVRGVGSRLQVSGIIIYSFIVMLLQPESKTATMAPRSIRPGPAA